jgi:hypothetical protein
LNKPIKTPIMKILFTLISGLLFFISSNGQTGPSFSITNTSGTNYITCSNTSVNYIASSTANLTYLWVSSNATLSGASVSITIPGNYSVTATDTLNNSSVKMLSVLINTFLPISTVSPNIQSITCSSPSAQFVIVVAPSPTITGFPAASQTQSISSQFGAAYVLNSNSPFIYQATAPGTYTYLQVDNNNGCSVVKQFTVTSNSGFPTFSLTSPQNYTLGCSNQSVASVMITNASATNSLQIPTGGAVSYTIIGPPTSSNYIPGNISNYTLSVPGTWTAIVKDNVSFCETRIPFSIISNTTSPNITVSVPKQILDCNTSQVNLIGSSNTPNVTYQWDFFGTPGMTLSDTINVQTNLSTPSATVINVYTLTITNNSSSCKSVSVVPMYQNLFAPNAAISSGGIFVLTCLTPSILLTNISTTGIPPSTGFPNNSPVIALQWIGPPFIAPPFGSSYIVSVAGTYTLEAKDLNNGCKSQTTIVIGDNQVYPQINLPGSYFVACPGTVTLSAIIVGSSPAHTYTWTAPINATTSVLNTPNLITSSPGYYYLLVTNTITGCSSTASTVVQACVGLESNLVSSYNINVFPNPGSGKFTLNSSALPKHSQLEIYTAMGLLIKSLNIESDQLEIDLENEAKGLYVIKVMTQSKLLSTHKIILQ